MSTAVLIVNYKAYDDLTRCLASLTRHLPADDQVVVVDYESSAAALAPAVAGHPVPTVARPGNMGFAAGANLPAAARGRHSCCSTQTLSPKRPFCPGAGIVDTSHPDVAVTGARVFTANGSV